MVLGWMLFATWIKLRNESKCFASERDRVDDSMTPEFAEGVEGAKPELSPIPKLALVQLTSSLGAAAEIWGGEKGGWGEAYK